MFRRDTTDHSDGPVCKGESTALVPKGAQSLCLELEKQMKFILKPGVKSAADKGKIVETVRMLCKQLEQALSEGGEESQPCQCLTSSTIHKSHHSRSLYMDVLRIVSASCLHGYEECMEEVHGDSCVAYFESVWLVYAVFSRVGKYGGCPYITHGCLVYLLQIYECFSFEQLDSCLGKHLTILLDEVIEILARMNDMKPPQGGDIPQFWYDFMIRGHLIISKESKNELVENNCISKAKNILAECYDELLPDEKVRACSVLALHHYEKACSLESSGTCMRSAIRHCNQSLMLIENILDYVEILEHSYELMTLMHQVRLLMAKAFLCSGDTNEALTELSRIPSLQKDEDPVRILVGFEVLFLRSKIFARLNNPWKCFECLGKDVPEAIAELKEDSDFIGKIIKALGCVISDIIIALPLVRDQNAIESFFTLLRATPCVGLGAFMSFISMVESHPEPQSFAVPLFIDIISDDRIVKLVTQERDNMDACWNTFQKIAYGLFVQGKIDTCILFQQACLHYGPVTKIQWTYILLMGLHVFSENRSMAEECLGQLNKESVKEPLVVLLRRVLLEEQHGNSQIKEAISFEDTRNIKWTSEYLEAMDEIAGFFKSSMQHPSALWHTASQGAPCCGDNVKDDQNFLKILKILRCVESGDDLPQTFAADLGKCVDAAMHDKQANSSMFARILRAAQRIRTIRLDDVSIQRRVPLIQAACQCLGAALSILEIAPDVVYNSEAVKITLCQARLERLVVLANEYFDMSFFGSQNTQCLPLLGQTMSELESLDHLGNEAMLLLGLRQGMLKGDVSVLNDENMQQLESFMGEEFYVSFIMHHMTSPGIALACLECLVEFAYQKRSDSDWRDILALSFQQQDSRKVLVIISGILRLSAMQGKSVMFVQMVKDLMHTLHDGTLDSRFAAKLSHDSPWIFRTFEASNCTPNISGSSFNNRRVSTASSKESVSQSASPESSAYSSPQKGTGIWNMWIQKVLRRHS